jgi:hypothetical protein
MKIYKIVERGGRSRARANAGAWMPAGAQGLFFIINAWPKRPAIRGLPWKFYSGFRSWPLHKQSAVLGRRQSRQGFLERDERT